MSERRVVAAALTALLVATAPLLPAAAQEDLPPAPDPLPHSGGLDAYDPLFESVEEEERLEHDPFEPANRVTFAFNEQLDVWVLDPVTRGYQWLVPAVARRSINHLFHNLNSPVIFANEVLQLRPHAAGATFGRFLANTTLGIGGLFDVADHYMQIPRGEADFGQTLARYRVPRGPYLVVPLFGPSTARDAMGTIVDQGLDPLTYLIGPLNLQWQLILGSGQGLAIRESNMDALDALRDASIDYYAALRSAYLQSRRAKELEVLWGGQTRSEPAEVDEGAPGPDQDSVPEASFSMRASIAAISASKSSRLTMPENSERRSASSLTVPSR